MQVDQPTQAIEDYLKIIYELTRSEKRAATNRIAEKMDVTPASVTGMLQRMAISTPPLVEYRKHHGVVLTDEGERIALQVIRHHRLLELFLNQKLGYRWDEVHEEADRLEHVISKELEDRIAFSLGNPSHDPHGHPIPDRGLQVPQRSSMSLAQLHNGQHAVVERVENEDAELLRYLADIGLIPGARITILDVSPYDSIMQVQINGGEKPISLGQRINSHVFVEVSQVSP